MWFDFPSLNKHAAFKLHSVCSQQDPCSFLWLKSWEYSKLDLMFWCNTGGGRLLEGLMELSNFLECLVRSLSGAWPWMEPSVPYWLKKLTSRAFSMWSGLPADKEGPHRLLGEGREGEGIRGADWEPAFTHLYHCVLSYHLLGAPHT